MSQRFDIEHAIKNGCKSSYADIFIRIHPVQGDIYVAEYFTDDESNKKVPPERKNAAGRPVVFFDMAENSAWPNQNLVNFQDFDVRPVESLKDLNDLPVGQLFQSSDPEYSGKVLIKIMPTYHMTYGFQYLCLEHENLSLSPVHFLEEVCSV